MLESFAAWIVNTYIGDYFGNVNTDQLHMSLKSGEIELERLPLKRDLIKHLGLPLEANTGYIGKISIKFPRWHLFTSEPLVITVEELYLLVKPITNFTYNEEEENRAQQEFKISQLDTLESRWKALHDDLTEQSSYYSSSYSSWLNYGSSFLTNILLNVHLKISKVHIRYEDQTSIPGCPFSTGVVIKSLSICSTDENWIQKYVTRDTLSANSMHKMIEMESFAVYFDTNTKLYQPPPPSVAQFQQILPLQSLVELMRENFELNLNRSGQHVEHSYIIAPVNGRCYLKRNCTELSLKSCKQPRTVIDVQLEQVPIMMTAIQYKHLLDWSIAFQTSKTLWKYRKWRPMIRQHHHRMVRKRTKSEQLYNNNSNGGVPGTATTINHDVGDEEENEEEEEYGYDSSEPEMDERNIRIGFRPKIWWHFAANAHLEEYRQRKQRFNLHFILQRFRDIVAYHRAYLHYLLYQDQYTREMRYLKDRVENEFTLDEICSIREMVFVEAERMLKEQNLRLKKLGNATKRTTAEVNNSNSHKTSTDDDEGYAEQDNQHQQQEPAASSGGGGGYSWFFPYSLISNIYNNAFTISSSSSSSAGSSEVQSPIHQTTSQFKEEEEAETTPTYRSTPPHHQRTLSSSSSSDFAASGGRTTNLTDDIFLLRDAVFCQFNFEIKNSSFQLIAFNTLDKSHHQTPQAPQLPGYQSSSSSKGNLLLDFEFTQMKIGVDITNPNAYNCVCHMNQGYRRRQLGKGHDSTTAASAQHHQSNHHHHNHHHRQTSPQKFLTQNELNMLQFNLNFECHNLSLTLLRTNHMIIIQNEAQKLVIAQLTGGGLTLVFSQHFVSIDGKLDSLEVIDMVTEPGRNCHRRVLSIGHKQQPCETGSGTTTYEEAAVVALNPVNNSSSLNTELEKALSFSLSRQFTENMLRLNIEMASFCYVHSAVLVHELSLCRECFSDVLEAYFSRSFKERVKAATTEMLKGIVKNAAAASSSTGTGTGTSSNDPFATPTIGGETSVPQVVSNKSNQSRSNSIGSLIHPNNRSRNTWNILGTTGKSNGGLTRPKSASTGLSSSSSMSPFVDNFKLNIFIRSPVIIFPIAPSSTEVVVFHLGHMLLNNHNQSADIFYASSASTSTPPSTSNNNNTATPTITTTSTTTASAAAAISSTHHHSSHYNNSYNAEIRDLSIYMLDCQKNVLHHRQGAKETTTNNITNIEAKGEAPDDASIPLMLSMIELYYCDLFGVPILQKTVIEIVLEKKVLLSSLIDSSSSLSIKHHNHQQQQRPLSSSRLSATSSSPQPPPSSSSLLEQQSHGKTSSSSALLTTHQDDSVLIDGLNIISTVNSIDPLRPPKKFSIRSHFHHSSSSDHHHHNHHHTEHQQQQMKPFAAKVKPELVLSVEVSLIDFRFSYTDLLVFWHIANTLMPTSTTGQTSTQQQQQAAEPNHTTTETKGIIDDHSLDDHSLDDVAPTTEDLEELYKELRRNPTLGSSSSSSQQQQRNPRHGDEDEDSTLLQQVAANMMVIANGDEFEGFDFSDLNPVEFKIRLDQLQDCGFEYRDALRALVLARGDLIEASYMLSQQQQQQQHNNRVGNELGIGEGGGSSENNFLSSDDNQSQCTFSTERSSSLQQLSTLGGGGGGNSSAAGSIITNAATTTNKNKSNKQSRNSATAARRNNSLLSSLSVIEIRILSGSIRVIDDCNQLDIPLIELGIRDFRLIQQQTSPVTEAYAQTNFYCDYYNSHLSGWEPFIEHCQVAFSWKLHQQRCHLKSMFTPPPPSSFGTSSTSMPSSMLSNFNNSARPLSAPRRKLALKIEVKKMFNLNVSRTLLDLVEKVRTTWVKDIVELVHSPPTQRAFRQRQPFIPFALRNETGSDIQLFVAPTAGGGQHTSQSISFATGKQADLITHCDLCSTLEVKASRLVCFDLVDRHQLEANSAGGSKPQHRRSRYMVKSTDTPQKIIVKVDGWSATFPLSIEREGCFIRHIRSERYFNQSAILVFDVALQATAVKVITVRSSLQVANRTSKNVELTFANTAMSADTKTSYIIAPSGLFPVPLKLLYARMQLRPCDLGLGACRTPIEWTHVRKYGEQHCSLQICTPITHTSQASYSSSAPCVVTVLVERNSIGALIDHRPNMTVVTSAATSGIGDGGGGGSLSVIATHHHQSPSPIIATAITTTTTVSNNSGGSSSSATTPAVYGQTPSHTIPSHLITLLPPLQLSNRLPYELKFVINQSTIAGTIRSGDDHSVHYVNPREQFVLEFAMEHFPKCKPLVVTPGATKDYSAQIDMYDTRGRLLVLHAAITVVSGTAQPCNAMTITVYSPYWIINRSGLPLIFAQEGVYTDSAGQYGEHERARSIAPLLYSYADAEAPKCAVMRLGRMMDNLEPRWCNFFLLEKGTFYRRLRVTEHHNHHHSSSSHRRTSSHSRSSSFNDMFSSSSPSSSLRSSSLMPTSAIITEHIYEFGIDIRIGRDRYSHTKIVTVAPRYQIENLTSYRLEFAQKYAVELWQQQSAGASADDGPSFSGPSSLIMDHSFGSSTITNSPSKGGGGFGSWQQRNSITQIDLAAHSMISALPKSSMPFHWPYSDKPKLLCVRIASFDGCLWSGSFSVGDEPSVSFHLNIRDDLGQSCFIRVEILLQNATYFIVFTDANSLPPPIRVENFSQVPIEFYQTGTTSMLKRTKVRANSSVPYALDEPSLPSHLTVLAPGGAYSTYDLNSFAPGANLTYDNFYYIAFEETFIAASLTLGGSSGYPFMTTDFDDDEEQLMLMMFDGTDWSSADLLDSGGGIHSQMLVLDVPDDVPDSLSPDHTTKPVVLTRKERGKRSQLWRIDLQNHIIHEGSAPPVEPGEIQDFGLVQGKISSSSFYRNHHHNHHLNHNQSDTLLVLDVADERRYTDGSYPLVIRKMNPARECTQTWLFTEDGRLRCVKYTDMFIQPINMIQQSSSTTDQQGQLTLNVSFRSGTPACLAFGPPVIVSSSLSDTSLNAANVDETTMATNIPSIPREQAIVKQKMRKGSGVLNVSILADGPSRVLRIKDQQMSANGRHVQLMQQFNYGSPFTSGQFGIERSIINDGRSTESFLVRLLRQTELELNLHIDSIGISVISKMNEEIVYTFMQRILLESTLNPVECRLHCVVQNFQVDNQLLHCEKKVLLYVGNLSSDGAGGTGTGASGNHQLDMNNVSDALALISASDALSQLTFAKNHQQSTASGTSSALSELNPAITFNAHKLFIPNVETNVFKSLQVTINDLVVNIDEYALLKLLEFINYDPVDNEMDEISSGGTGTTVGGAISGDTMYHANRNLSSSLSRSVQYYFAYLLIQLSQVKLSVFTSAQRVNRYLKELKKKAGIKLIRFEDALIQLQPFHKVYSLMTRRFLLDSIQEHYRSELRSQAAKILGTVDFLGNPVGFLNDMVDGFSELLGGNVAGWIWNVTHGISDSTAKFTSVLSESLGSVTMDSRYQEIRHKIKQQSTIGGQRAHLSAGARGLAHGIFGGITSLITQTYDGVVTTGGVTGLLSGFGKGLLGTITKPAVGMLDFASGAATAVRDSSRKATTAGLATQPVRRIRLPRTLTIDGRLTTYDSIQATWQSRYYHTSDFGPREYREQFVHVFLLANKHFMLLTTERLFFFHSTLSKMDLPKVDELEDQLEFSDSYANRIAQCSILQLQVINLDQFVDVVHLRMRARHAQQFVRKHGAQQTCLDFGSLPPDHLCDFVEFRQPRHTNTYTTSGQYHQTQQNGSIQSAATYHQPKYREYETDTKTNNGQVVNIVDSIEYPKILALCYVYSSDTQTMQQMVRLVNEAKHLLEERKFQVATPFETGDK